MQCNTIGEEYNSIWAPRGIKELISIAMMDWHLWKTQNNGLFSNLGETMLVTAIKIKTNLQNLVLLEENQQRAHQLQVSHLPPATL